MDSNSIITSDMGVLKIGKDRSPVLPKEKDPSFNVRDRLNDVLLCEKHMMSGYGTGTNEVIDRQLSDVVNQNMNSLKALHQNMLNMLFDLGEYQADKATAPQIQDTYDMFNNYKVQLPYPQQ